MAHLASLNTSIKELSSSVTFIPVNYISTDPKDASNVDPLENEIPIIDYSMLVNGTHEQRAEMVSELGRACQQWGFFMVVNHSISDELIDMMVNASKEFFDMNEDEKRECGSWQHPLDPVRYGSSFNPNFEDVQYWRDYLKLFAHPELHSPSKPLPFRDVLKEYTSSCRALAMDLLGGIWEGLGLDANHMRQVLKLDSCYQVFAANLYPPCPQSELVMGLPPHSDHGLLTIVYQDGPNGLEIKYGSKWIRVIKPFPNAILVNTGDHMEIVTNGKYKGGVHRAMINNHSTRMSIVNGIGPALDAVVEPNDQLINIENPPKFTAISFHQFLQCHQENTLKEKSVLDLLRI